MVITQGNPDTHPSMYEEDRKVEQYIEKQKWELSPIATAFVAVALTTELLVLRDLNQP